MSPSSSKERISRVRTSAISAAFVAAILAGACADALAQAVARPPLRRPGNAVRPVTAASSSGGSAPVTMMDDSPNSLNFAETPLDQVLTDYATRTKRILLINPAVPKPAITLTSPPGSQLTEDEYLRAVEHILNLNGIALKPIGDKFLQVLPSAELSKNAPNTQFTTTREDGRKKFDEDGKFVSAMIELQYIDITEAKTIIDGFVRQGAQIITFERTNSIIVNDSADNVNRIVEILGYIDKPIIAREETRVIKIENAKAADIKSRLQEIIQESQDESSSAKKKTTAAVENRSGSPGTTSRPLPPGITLPRTNVNAARESEPPSSSSYESLVQDAERGIIRGKVTLIADERTNLLIIITRPENIVFFEKVIKVLDVPTDPDVMVEVVRLEHAVAETVAGLLNDLIGNSKTGDRSFKSTSDSGGANADRSQSLSEFASHRDANRNQGAATGDGKTAVGRLDKENIKILAYEESNSIVIMASKGDMTTIRELIKNLDIQLSQVAIETAIISITTDNSLETGVDWVQRAMSAGKADGSDKPAVIYASAGGGGLGRVRNPMGLTTTDALADFATSGAAIFGTVTDLNLDFILKVAQTDSRAKVVSTPCIVTRDNKEAQIESTDRVYWKEGTTYYSNSDYTSENIKNEDVGIKLTVTPRINNKGYITLTIEQEIQSLDGYQTIDSSSYPKLNTRKMGSDIAVNSGETIILGGLAQNKVATVKSKIPILGSIPLLGRLFRYDSEERSRTDVFVFITPKVMDSPREIADYARKTRATIDTEGVWRGDWSISDLADPIPQNVVDKMVKRASNTMAPPKYPLSGPLEPLNERFGLADSDEETAVEGPAEESSKSIRIELPSDEPFKIETPADDAAIDASDLLNPEPAGEARLDAELKEAADKAIEILGAPEPAAADQAASEILPASAAGPSAEEEAPAAEVIEPAGPKVTILNQDQVEQIIKEEQAQ